MGCCGPKTRYFILLVVGVIFIVLPFALDNYINKLIRTNIDEEVVIKPGSQVYDQWRKPTLPVYLRIYTFSIMNSLEVKEGKPPVVVEKGPYSYRESKTKVNISWGHGNGNVTYNEVSNYIFDNKTSCASCNPSKDKVTTFNIPFVAITQIIKQLNVSDFGLWKYLLDIFLESIKDDLFIEKTVNETVWGYVDPLFKRYNTFRNMLLSILGPFWRHLAERCLPELSPVFALQPNPSYDGVTTVKTGQGKVDHVGLYEEWKGAKTLDFWTSKSANMLNGTDGSIYKPHITKDDKLYIFITQLCRSLHVIYLSDGTKIKGIGSLRFHPPKSTFVSGNINPDNKGFCVPEWNCLPSGLLSIKKCLPLPAPIFVSSPHFLNGDPTLLKKVVGLHPDEEKHDTFVYIEPNTGILLRASKRLQFNIHVEPVDGFSQTSGLTPTYVPIMWVNEHVTIDSKNADKLKKDLLEKLEIIKWVKIGLYILGSLLVLIALILFVRLYCRSKKDRTHLAVVSGNGHSYGATNDHDVLNPTLINAGD